MPLDAARPDPRASLLLDARDCIDRVTWHERWDMSAQRYAYVASEYLRAAGLAELADDCAEEFGIDATAILAVIDRELGRDG